MFVLAHISDPHLAPLPRPHWSELIGKRATGFVNWNRKRRLIHRADVLARVTAHLRASDPDHIAVTGDLVNLALNAEFALALTWLQSVGAPDRVTAIPGNHDAYVRGADAHFRSHWGQFMRDDDISKFGFPFVRRRGPVALIGLSSAVPTAPFLATGRLGREQIGRLAELLDECGRQEYFRVVLVHHPPRSSLRRHFKRLLDAPRFRAVLARHGAELVLHGHDHVHSLTHLQGPVAPIPAVGVPSASQAPRPGHDAPGYNLCHIEGRPGSWRCEIVARGLGADGESMTEIRRTSLALE